MRGGWRGVRTGLRGLTHGGLGSELLWAVRIGGGIRDSDSLYRIRRRGKVSV